MENETTKNYDDLITELNNRIEILEDRLFLDEELMNTLFTYIPDVIKISKKAEDEEA